jgi:hypothetical protein
MEVYVAPFGEAVAEMTVAQLKLATSVDHLVCVGEEFDRRLWSERWKRLPGSHDPSWLDWLRGGRHATTLELRRAAHKLQRELGARLEREVTWEEDADLEVAERQALSARLAPPAAGLHRLAVRLGGGGPLSADDLVAVLAHEAPVDDEARAAALDDPKHAFVQLLHLDAGSMLVPADFDAVLEGVPFTIGSAPELARELERLRALLAPALTESAKPSGPVTEVVESIETLARLAKEAVDRRLPLFVTNEPTSAPSVAVG